MTILFLDDMEIRIPMLREGETVDYVRTPEEFKTWLQTNGTPDMISFDHDLAEDHYTADGGYSNQNRTWTGTDCARWAVENGYIPARVIVHSWNPAGSSRIADCFKGTNTTVKICKFNPYRYLT